MESYVWEPRDRFLNRADDVAALEDWWAHPTRDALALVGRRRVGKSWLFRRFADGKPAVILVSDRGLATTQMAHFAKVLEPHVGVRPDIGGVPELIRILYDLGREQPVLAVIDEFPFLIPDGSAREEVLSEIQAAMEDRRDSSRTKLVLCGSLIGQMEALLHERSPLHGRLRRLDVWPLTFAESRVMTSSDDTAEERIVRYAVAGGMARYLSELGDDSLKDAVCHRVLNRRSALFDDPRAVLEQELRSPATYFSILAALARGPASTDHLLRELRLDKSNELSPYLSTLRQMRLLQTSLPVGAPGGSHSAKHAVADGFIGFWFRFVFPHQEGLQQGLSPEDLWDAVIQPHLGEFVAPSYEELCARYVRRTCGAIAPTVGGWWGPALNVYRRTKERLAEEIDVVAAQYKNLKAVGECKWTTSSMPASVLSDLREFKLPAIAQERRLKVPSAPRIFLFSRSGFAPELIQAAERDPQVTLVAPGELVGVLDSEIE